MQISTIKEIKYRPSEKARNYILQEKEKYEKKSMNQIIDEAIINQLVNK